MKKAFLDKWRQAADLVKSKIQDAVQNRILPAFLCELLLQKLTASILPIRLLESSTKVSIAPFKSARNFLGINNGAETII